MLFRSLIPLKKPKLTDKKQRNGKMIKPNGKKKYGGNKSEVKSPKIK